MGGHFDTSKYILAPHKKKSWLRHWRTACDAVRGRRHWENSRGKRRIGLLFAEQKIIIIARQRRLNGRKCIGPWANSTTRPWRGIQYIRRESDQLCETAPPTSANFQIIIISLVIFISLEHLLRVGTLLQTYWSRTA